MVWFPSEKQLCSESYCCSSCVCLWNHNKCTQMKNVPAESLLHEGIPQTLPCTDENGTASSELPDWGNSYEIIWISLQMRLELSSSIAFKKEKLSSTPITSAPCLSVRNSSKHLRKQFACQHQKDVAYTKWVWVSCKQQWSYPIDSVYV